jgi:hypothetical protein
VYFYDVVRKMKIEEEGLKIIKKNNIKHPQSVQRNLIST